ncbi:MAG: right-handed parallel beta-helix repeat-containing protein, partial [Calditrichia bacterium]|nr:right-handed parallel beta-helix repeat-containing protein [Calditrichia bacterium]
GYTNIPYYFHDNYAIGTSVTLTIKPGVILKFSGEGYNTRTMTVRRGLIAEGGPSADSTIVFTDIRDDFYGGDSNADSTATVPGTSNRGWGGIIFEDEAMDELCYLKHCIFKHVKYSSYNYAAITTNSASPLIENCTFTDNAYGIIANNSSNPVINYCDIYDNTYMGVYNVHETFFIDAENNWWGNNSGPTHDSNPGGTGDVVSDAVDFLPFLSDGTYNPDMGDVSLNGEVQPYDASLVLQHWVGSITLNDLQQSVPDVSGEEGITSYDASLILQYTVGLIPGFPAEIGSKIAEEGPDYIQLAKVLNGHQVDNVLLEIESVNAQRGENVVIPLKLNNALGLVAWQTALKYDPDYLKLESVSPVSGTENMMLFDGNNSEEGELRIAMAGTQPVENEE